MATPITQTQKTLPTSGDAFLDNLQNFLAAEDAERFKDMFIGFVLSGGTHSTGATLTHSPASLTAYPGGFYITETGSITYPDATTHLWVICHKDTTTAVTNWTREAGTHYLFRNTASATKPALPVVDSAILMKVTTSGGAVTAVEDHRITTPESNTYSGTPQTLTGAGAVDIITATTHVVTTGTNALTLIDGVEGQRKFIVMKTDGGVGTLTPSNLGNGATLVFDDVGDSADLIFTNSAWHFMGGTATLA